MSAQRNWSKRLTIVHGFQPKTAILTNKCVSELFCQSTSAPELWMQYELLTASLSQQLCEELRIILKPTKASQLK